MDPKNITVLTPGDRAVEAAEARDRFGVTIVVNRFVD
jgi:hypothetical protein